MNDESGRAVTARIAIAVRSDGEWQACGWSGGGDNVTRQAAAEELPPDPPSGKWMLVTHYVTVEVPVPDAPDPQELTAEVES